MLLHPHASNVAEFPLHAGPENTWKLLALAGLAIIPRAIKTPKHRSATTLPVVAMVYCDVHAGNRREERENINGKSVLTLQGILDMCVKYQLAPRGTPMPSKLMHFRSVYKYPHDMHALSPLWEYSLWTCFGEECVCQIACTQ